MSDSSVPYRHAVTTFAAMEGIFEQVRFYPIMNFGPLLGPPVFSMLLPYNECWPFLVPPSPWTFHNVNNDGDGAHRTKKTKKCENKQKKKKKEKKKRNKTERNKNQDNWGGTNNIVRDFLVRTSPAEGSATFSQKHGLCPFRA